MRRSRPTDSREGITPKDSNESTFVTSLGNEVAPTFFILLAGLELDLFPNALSLNVRVTSAMEVMRERFPLDEYAATAMHLFQSWGQIVRRTQL